MMYVRIKSYLDGMFTTCEQLYSECNQSEAIQRFRDEYPEHKDCTVIAEDYNSEENPEHFEICKACGCVH